MDPVTFSYSVSPSPLTTQVFPHPQPASPPFSELPACLSPSPVCSPSDVAPTLFPAHVSVQTSSVDLASCHLLSWPSPCPPVYPRPYSGCTKSKEPELGPGRHGARQSTGQTELGETQKVRGQERSERKEDNTGRRDEGESGARLQLLCPEQS